MAISSSKLRMLYLMKILLEQTDESHAMSAVNQSTERKAYGMTIDREKDSIE